MLAISVLLLTNCNCHYCTDNISAENEKIPYQNKELVEFTNDTLGSVFDTVYVELGSPSRKAYGCNGTTDSDNELCAAYSSLSYSNHFYLQIIQMSNRYNNEIVFNYSWSMDYEDFIFNNKTIPVIHMYFETDTLGSIIWKENISKDSSFVYNNYYFTNDTIIKLLQYSTIYKDGTRRIWRLKE